jgi:C4-dicarboxylate transporter DctQ subunit
MFSKLRDSLTRIAEFITAILLAVIFITFLLQIFTRYAPKIAWLAPFAVVESWMASLVPIGWTVNLISLLWVWLIFVGCSFALQDRDHVTFDVFYNAVTLQWRRIFAVITTGLLIGVFAYALGPTFDAVFGSRLMDLKKIQTIVLPISGEKIAIKWLFAPVVLFMVVTILRSGMRLYKLCFEISSKSGENPKGISRDNGGLS